MKDQIESFRDHFNDLIEEVKRFAFFVRAKEFQEASINTLEKLIGECTEAKERAIARNAEEEANAFLAFEFMTTALIEEFHFYLDLKADDPDAAWDHLINAQSSTTSAIKSHAVASHLEGYVQRLYALERLLFPQLVFFSSGFIVRESECSICGADYGECDHIKGRPYMGKMCARIVKEAELREASIVSDPANKHCRALHYTDKGITRNVFSQRIVSSANTQHAPKGDVVKAQPKEEC
jgi:hypothetical protein